MTEKTYGMGWQRDLPDLRDYPPENVLDKTSKALKSSPKSGLPAKKDLSKWCSPIEDQLHIGSCTANAGVGLIEYFENRAFGKHLDASRLFLYKATRNLLGWTGDTGAWLRTTMQAMVLFGIPPTKYWEYDVSKFDVEPDAFLYAFASNYQAIQYYRLDQPGISGTKLRNRVKHYINYGYPSMFGFTVYNHGNDDGEIDFPEPTDSVKGGHAVVAVGYDDNRMVGRRKGALKIRNSWGTGWGQEGYGWLPYAYVDHGLAVDFWSLFKAEYVDTGHFQ
jgi:C1A family cysteine protease